MSPISNTMSSRVIPILICMSVQQLVRWGVGWIRLLLEWFKLGSSTAGYRMLGHTLNRVRARIKSSSLKCLIIPYSASPRGLYSTLSRLPFSHLLGPESHYDKLVTLASAASAQRAVNYNLNLSILLKGTRGIGKFTTAFWVAQRLGMHLLEVRVFRVWHSGVCADSPSGQLL